MSVPDVGNVLRPYQQAVVDDARGVLRGGLKRLALVAPTGAGKTVCAAEVIRGAQEKGSKVLFLAHRRELIFQASAKLSEWGVHHGVILAGESETMSSVQVASVQTLSSRISRGRLLPDADLVIIDECHRSLAPTYLELIAQYSGRGAVVLGLTATPVRGDGRGLGDVYQAIVSCPSIASLTSEGYLVPVRYYAPTIPDLHGMKTSNGDYALDALQAYMDRPKLVGNVLENWQAVASDRPTIVFASGVQHSVHLRDEFRGAGIKAEHVDGTTHKDERDEIFEELRRGGIQVVTNCDVATEGWDCPMVSCGVMARPTKSLVRYLQMAGRILRPSPGKQDAVLIDHAGLVYEHGFLHEFGDWSLDSAKGDTPNDTQAERREKGARPLVCERCATMFAGKKACPECGHENERKGKVVAYVDARLGEVLQQEAKASPYTNLEKQQWYRELIGYARGKAYKRAEGWAYYAYQDKFHEKPGRQWSREPLAPTSRILGFIKYRAIRFHKSRAAGNDMGGAAGRGQPRGDSRSSPAP